MKPETRFLKYISIDTQSDETSMTSPSTPGQRELGEFLAEEMRVLKMEDVMIDEFGVVYGTIPGNTSAGDVMGFISHMDTAEEASGKDIHPQIIRNYDGGTITINADKGMTMSPEDTPELLSLIHHDLVTTDGTTLLGADDKAGITIIMSMAEYLYTHPDFKHNDIRVAFTPDEEIGRGTDHFNIERFDAEYAYTVDGGDINLYAYETFNAYKAEVTFTGRSVHPGDAKGKMVNALTLARDFDTLLGDVNRPEHTEGYEGFYHLLSATGDVSEAKLDYIIREHDEQKLYALMDRMSAAADYINKAHGHHADISFTKQYLNMRPVIEHTPEIVEQVRQAMLDLGMEPQAEAVRGGTDGAMLSYKGLPCPNLGTGGYNFHGPYEFLSLTQMKKGVDLLLRIIKNNVEKEGA